MRAPRCCSISWICQWEDAAFTQLSPEERKARTFRVLHWLSRSVCQRQPLVLAVEDVHWIDATSEAWLATLVERLAGTPSWSWSRTGPGISPWLGQSSATQVALPRLTPQESLLVVQGVLQTATVPAAVGHEIVTKAAGNPFFLEELSWTARTSGPAHPLPDAAHDDSGGAGGPPRPPAARREEARADGGGHWVGGARAPSSRPSPTWRQTPSRTFWDVSRVRSCCTKRRWFLSRSIPSSTS